MTDLTSGYVISSIWPLSWCIIVSLWEMYL